MYMDENFKKRNPLDSVDKLRAIGSIAENETMITWTVEMLLDLFKAGGISGEQIGLRALEGKTVNSGGKGLVHLLVYKYDLLQQLIKMIDDMSWPITVKQAMRDACLSLSVYRSKCGYVFNPRFKKVTLHWRHSWPQSADHFMDLIDHAIFGYQYDAGLRSALRCRRDVKSCLSQSPFAEVLQGVQE